MASCWVLVGLVVVSIAFVATAVSYVVPYWYPVGTSGEAGLWAQCSYSGDATNMQSCTWPWQDQAAWLSKQEAWHWVTQALMGVGLILLGLAFIGSCIALCSVCCRPVCPCVSIVSGLLICAFSLVTAAIIVYGVFASQKQSGSSGVVFLWGYWVGVGGAVFSFFSALLYTVECCRGYTHDGYTRGKFL